MPKRKLAQSQLTDFLSADTSSSTSSGSPRNRTPLRTAATLSAVTPATPAASSSFSFARLTSQQISKGCWIDYSPSFMTRDQSQSLWKEVTHQCGWEQGTFLMFGREVRTPRLQSWMADEGVTNEQASLFQKQPSLRWTPMVRSIKESLEHRLHCHFDYVLIQQYRDGNDHISWHSDGEALAPDRSIIASVSIGAMRPFQLRHNHWRDSRDNQRAAGEVGRSTSPSSSTSTSSSSKITLKTTAKSSSSETVIKVPNPSRLSFELNNGSLIVMRGHTQRDWKHRLPKRPKLKEPRINLTFRKSNA